MTRCFNLVFSSEGLYCIAETDNGIFKQILNGKVDLDSKPWPNISDITKDLVRKMLDRDPKLRISAHEMLCEYIRLC